VWCEDDWNTTSTLVDGPYRLSKVLAEKYTWEWAANHPKIPVAVILPTFIIGPPQFGRCDATSIKNIKAIMDGTALASGGVQAACFGAIDIRDCARAHISAFEKGAKGRFLISSERGVPGLEMAKVLKKHFPSYPIPDTQIGQLVYRGGNIPTGGYSNKKARAELGIEFTPWEKSIVDMAHKLIELGIVPKM